MGRHHCSLPFLGGLGRHGGEEEKGGLFLMKEEEEEEEEDVVCNVSYRSFGAPNYLLPIIY